eukprot:gene10313-19011_t
MLEMNGKSLRGFERITPPIMDELCMEDGQSNCQGLFGEDLSFCQDVCCKLQENNAEADNLKIKCINLNIEDKIIQGFERIFPPIQNDTCYDDDGFSNCDTLLEPERSFCARKCCIDSFTRSTPPPPNKNRHHDGKNPGYPAADMDSNACGQLEKELHRWRNTTYAFEIISFVLLVVLVILIAVLCCTRKKWEKKGKIQFPADMHSSNVDIALPGRTEDRETLL